MTEIKTKSLNYCHKGKYNCNRRCRFRGQLSYEKAVRHIVKRRNKHTYYGGYCKAQYTRLHWSFGHHFELFFVCIHLFTSETFSHMSAVNLHRIFSVDDNGFILRHIFVGEMNHNIIVFKLFLKISYIDICRINLIS